MSREEVLNLEEKERMDRLAGDERRCQNSHTVAGIIQKLEFPVLKHGSRGSSRHFHSLAERERARLLASPDEIKQGQALGRSMCELFKGPSWPTLSWCSRKGTHNMFRRVEERERNRRIANKDECATRKLNGSMLSEGIRVEGTILRARLVRRNRPIHKKAPTTWQLAKNTLAAAADLATVVTENAIHDAQHALHDVVESASHAASDAASQAGHAMLEAGKKTSSLPSLIKNKAASIFSSMQNALRQSQEMVTPPLTERQHQILFIRGLEEMERQRRISEDHICGVPANAKRLSRVLVLTGFPTFQTRKGFKRYTQLLQERERMRRLMNKDECKRRQLGANKVAACISQMGWPFIASAKNTFTAAPAIPATNLFEDERRRRMRDNKTEWCRRENARKTAGWIKQAMFPQQQKAAFLRDRTNKLEEQERSWRIQNCGHAIGNAHREAALIAGRGFKQPMFAATAKMDVKQIARHKIDKLQCEERELRKSARLNASAKLGKSSGNFGRHKLWQSKDEEMAMPRSRADRQISFESAQDVENLINQDIELMENCERRARLADRAAQQQAIENAQKVSGMINILMKRQQCATCAAQKSLPVSGCESAKICMTCPRLDIYLSPNRAQSATRLKKSMSAPPTPSFLINSVNASCADIAPAPTPASTPRGTSSSGECECDDMAPPISSGGSAPCDMSSPAPTPTSWWSRVIRKKTVTVLPDAAQCAPATGPASCVPTPIYIPPPTTCAPDYCAPNSGIPPYSGGGVPPYSGGVPPYSGGGVPPYSGGGVPPYSGGGVPPYSGGGLPPNSGSGLPPNSGGGLPPNSGGSAPSSGGSAPSSGGSAPPSSGIAPPSSGSSFPSSGPSSIAPSSGGAFPSSGPSSIAPSSGGAIAPSSSGLGPAPFSGGALPSSIIAAGASVGITPGTATIGSSIANNGTPVSSAQGFAGAPASLNNNAPGYSSTPMYTAPASGGATGFSNTPIYTTPSAAGYSNNLAPNSASNFTPNSAAGYSGMAPNSAAGYSNLAPINSGYSNLAPTNSGYSNLAPNTASYAQSRAPGFSNLAPSAAAAGPSVSQYPFTQAGGPSASQFPYTQPAATSASQFPYTQAKYNAPMTSTTPSSFGSQGQNYGGSQWDQAQQMRLVEAVRKQEQRESALADKEAQKVAKITGTSVFSKLRLQKHENAALKHRNNAQRHAEWLSSYTASSKPAL